MIHALGKNRGGVQMSHPHTIIDKDTHFIIDSVTRKIQPETPTKNKLGQYDHNSERYTFEIDKMIEGHDMSQCDIVEVHYINISSDKGTRNKGNYRVKDLNVPESNPEKVTFSWLISKNATMLNGMLTFCIRFACSENSEITYDWHTDIYSRISVTSSIYNNEDIVEEYADVLLDWYEQLFSVNSVIIETKNEALESIKTAKEDAISSFGEYGGVQVTEEEPTNPNIGVQIVPNLDEEFIMPEINDSEISSEDTWSSKKISDELTKLREELLKSIVNEVRACNNG